MGSAVNCNNPDLEKAGKLYDKLEKLGTAHLFGSREEYLKDVEEWHNRNIPKKDEEQMRKDAEAYIDYCIGCLSGKLNFDFKKAQELYKKTEKWKPQNYPLKK